MGGGGGSEKTQRQIFDGLGKGLKGSCCLLRVQEVGKVRGEDFAVEWDLLCRDSGSAGDWKLSLQS